MSLKLLFSMINVQIREGELENYRRRSLKPLITKLLSLPASRRANKHRDARALDSRICQLTDKGGRLYGLLVIVSKLGSMQRCSPSFVCGSSSQHHHAWAPRLPRRPAFFGCYSARYKTYVNTIMNPLTVLILLLLINLEGIGA